MKHTRKLVFTILLVLLTLLTVASAVLCYLFMPIAWENSWEEDIHDDVAFDHMSRWEFNYTIKNQGDQQCFLIKLDLPVPSEAFQLFTGNSYKEDKNQLSQYFDDYVSDFLATHKLVFPTAKINSHRTWLRSIYNDGSYSLNTSFRICIENKEITPREYLKAKQIIKTLLKDKIIDEGKLIMNGYSVEEADIDNSNNTISMKPSSHDIFLSPHIQQHGSVSFNSNRVLDSRSMTAGLNLIWS